MFISECFCLVFHALSIISVTGCQTSFSMTENCKLHWFSDPSSTCTSSALQQVTENMQVNVTQSDKIHTQLLIFFQFYFLLSALNCWIQKKCKRDYFGSFTSHLKAVITLGLGRNHFLSFCRIMNSIPV